MKEAVKDRWRARLAQSDALWSARGLTGRRGGTGRVGSGGAHESFDLRHTMAMYGGREHWHGVSGFGEYGFGDRPIANSMFTSLNTFEAQLMARAPRALLFPRSRARADAANRARVTQVVLNYFIAVLGMKKQVNRAQRDAFFAPFGIVVHGFTPEEEHRDEQGRLLHFNGTSLPTAPWVRRKPIWDFRGDVFRGTLDSAEMAWMAVRDWYTPEMVQRNPGMKRAAKKKLHATRVLGEDFLPNSVDRADQDPDDYRELVEVWSIYDRIDRTWFQVSPGFDDYVLREPSEWPLDWIDLPVSLIHFNEQPHDPFPIPYAQVLMPIQIERNKLRTMASQMVKSIKRLTVVNPETLEPESEHAVKSGDLATVEILLARMDPKDVIAQTTVSDLPQQLLQWDAVMKEEIREVMGQSNMDRAQRINVESASEASFVKSGSDTQRSRNQAAVEDHWRDVLEKFSQGLRTQGVADPTTIVPITGEIDIEALVQIQGRDVLGRDSQPFLEASAEDIAGDYLVQIEVGSTMPRSQQEEVARAQAWLQLGAQFPQNVNIPAALIDAAVAFGKSPARALLSGPQQQATSAEGEPGQVEGAPQSGGGGVDLTLLGGGGQG